MMCAQNTLLRRLARAALGLAVTGAIVAPGSGAAQDWTPYASPEEGFSVEAPGTPQRDRRGFEPAKMTGLRNHAWPKPAGGAYLVSVVFRSAADMAKPADLALREAMTDAKGQCGELRDQRSLEIAGGTGVEFVVTQCPDGVAMKARVYAADERLVAAVSVGTSGVEQADDTRRFLDSLRLTAVVPAVWKSHAVAQDGFSVDLPGTPTVEEGFNPASFTAGRAHRLETRTSEFVVQVLVRRRDGMVRLPNEQLLAALLGELKGDCEQREQMLDVPGGVAAELVKECADGDMMRTRIHLVDDRLYQLVAGWQKGMDVEIDRFFDSFRLLPVAAGQVAAAPAPPPAAKPAPATEPPVARPSASPPVAAAPPPRAAPAAPPPPAWKTFAVAEDGFSIDFPGTPAPLEVKVDPDTMVSYRQHGLEYAGAGWIVAAVQFKSRGGGTDDALLSAMKGGMQGQCTLRDERNTAFPGGLASEFIVERCPDGTVTRARLAVVGDRVYQALVSGPPGLESRPETQRFLDSLRLTTPARPQAASPAAAVAAAAGPSVAALVERQSGDDLRCPDERAAKSSDSKQAASIVFRNNRTSPVRIYWLDYRGRRELYADLAPGKQHVQETYTTHPWVVTDTSERCLGMYLPERARRVEIR